jgi:MoaA/NifB/PqqE/SkfB family radical SAM enzyme
LLVTVLKQIFRREGGLDEQLAEWSREPFYDEQKIAGRIRDKSEYLRQAGYLRYPALVHIETQAVCNAACTFCPYPTLERKGERMSDALIEKILGDLAAIPRELPFQLSPYKVSDPFLEARLFDILRTANERLPNARISLITNGAALTDRNVAKLQDVRNIQYLNISLNHCEATQYEAVMKMPFERTLKRLDALHESRPAFPVRLTRVSVDRDSDVEFIAWTKKRYPSFHAVIIPRNDWIGDIPGAQASMVPDTPCHRWFDFSITSTGKVAMCCMDGRARYPKGDVNHEHVLDIYNRPFLLDLRTRLISRREAGDPCRQCTYLSF